LYGDSLTIETDAPIFAACIFSTVQKRHRIATCTHRLDQDFEDMPLACTSNVEWRI
jgi:hypothetical protein